MKTKHSTLTTFIALTFGALFFLSGCTSLVTQWEKNNPPSVIGKKLWLDLRQALAPAVRQAVVALAQSALDGGNADWGHVVANALMTAGSITNIEQFLNDATGNAVPNLAHKAAELAAQAEAGGLSKQDARNAVAATIFGQLTGQ